MTKPQDTPQRIAVIAVHGVGRHEPGETSRAVANLLVKHGGAAQVETSYIPYDETTIAIPTRPVDLSSRSSTASVSPPPSSRFDERSNYVRSLLQGSPAATTSKVVPDQDDRDAIGFMHDQLREYQPREADAIYNTHRLRTIRSSSDGSQDVHVYEMFWSNLSRSDNGFLRVFGELYQLLLHVGSLGRQTSDFARAAHKDDENRMWWECFNASVTWATRILSLPIPIFNLLMLATVLMPLPGQIFNENIEYCRVASLLILGLVGGVLSILVNLQLRILRWGLWLITPLASAAIFVILGDAVLKYSQHAAITLGPFQLLALEYVAGASVIYAIVVRAYNQNRPGATTVGLWLGLGLLIGVVIPQLLIASEIQAAIFDAALKIAEIIYLCLVVCWLGLLACTWLAPLTGILAIATTRSKDPVGRSRDGRAVATACLALSLPSALFLTLTLVLYTALNQVGTYAFPPHLQYQPTMLSVKYLNFPDSLPAVEFLRRLIATSGTPAFVGMLVVLACAIIMGIWALLPVVLTDLSAPQKTTFRRSLVLGTWLTNGYRLLGWSAATLFLAFPVAITVGVICQWISNQRRFVSSEDTTSQVLGLIATLIVGSVSGLLAFNGRLEVLAVGFRPILDTILDIDNYLREHPRDNNPRSRICSRYVSLLDYICQFQDPRDKGMYSGVIIVAHSQGTVITAELLRFLNFYPDKNLVRLRNGEIPIYLFTVGCPLRQLYGWRFPHLYAWARHDVDKPWTVGAPAFIPESQQPHPEKLGVPVWVNAFCSGDYVGRHLWRSDNCNYQWGLPEGFPTVVSIDEQQARQEYCLGAGGHTHYFDDISPQVAARLNLLLAQTANKGKPLPQSVFATEILEPNEEKLRKQIVNFSLQLLDESTHPVHRGQHPKQHGCVKATFTVLGHPDQRLAVGLFSRPQSYEAYLRFSNGMEFDDTHADIHGLAIKVLGVEGNKILEDEQTATTQDFVLMDHPTFFIRNLTDYADFTQLILDTKEMPRWFIVLRLFLFFFVRDQMVQFRILREARGKRIPNPFDTNYWSTTPYAFGQGSAVKYHVQPRSPAENANAPMEGRDYLQESMQKRLNDVEDVCFDFFIQFQHDPVQQPIEDPTVDWGDSWIKVAEIKVPRQDFAESMAMCECENTVFTPWHSLPEHRPLGGINRVRKDVYRALSNRRLELNHVRHREP